MASEEKLYTVLQLCDSVFPTGGFSHSMGSEAAVGSGYIQCKDDLLPFISSSLENIGSLVLPFVKASHEKHQDIEEVAALDILLDVFLSSHVAKRASLQQGGTLLMSASEAFDLKQLKVVEDQIDSGKMPGHQSIIFGIVCATLEIPVRKTAEMFMFNSLRTIMASLVRLGKIGAIEAQQYQFRLKEHLDYIISRNWDTHPKDACLRFPILDVIQMSHDTMYSRLFIS